MGAGGLEVVEAAFQSFEDSLAYLGADSDVSHLCVSRPASFLNRDSKLVKILLKACHSVFRGESTVTVSSRASSILSVSPSIPPLVNQGYYNFGYDDVQYEAD